MEKKILELIAEVDHEQWMYWIEGLIKKESVKIDEEQLNLWDALFCPYEQLNEGTKEHDRKWARRELNKIVSFLMNKGEFKNLSEEGKKEHRYLLLPKEAFDELLEATENPEESSARSPPRAKDTGFPSEVT